MIHKLVTVPLGLGYRLGKAGLGTFAKGAKKITPNIAPVVQSVDVDKYYAGIESRRKHQDVAQHVKENPEKKQSLEECINVSLKKHGAARKWAGVIDTVDKVTAPVGVAADYLIFMTGTAGFALGLAEEAVEFTALKAPFMTYYASKNPKRIPGWLAYEFFSHVLPFGDALDLRNNYVNSVDKDIENYAVTEFRKLQGLEKQGWLKKLVNRFRKKSESEEDKMEDKPEEKKLSIDNLIGLPNPWVDPENRVKDYMNSVAEGSYDTFMNQRKTTLPKSLERFVKWGHNPWETPHWYSSHKEFAKNSDRLHDLVDAHLGEKKPAGDTRMINAAYELEIAGERKYVVEVTQELEMSYAEAHNVPKGQVAPCVQVGVRRRHKIIFDAETGRVEDSYRAKDIFHRPGDWIIGSNNPIAKYQQKKKAADAA